MHGARHRDGRDLAARRVAAAIFVVALLVPLVASIARGGTPVTGTPATELAAPATSLAESEDTVPTVPPTTAMTDPETGDTVQTPTAAGPSAGPDNELLTRKPSDLNAELTPKREKAALAQRECVPRIGVVPMRKVRAFPVASGSNGPWVLAALAVAAAGTLLAAGAFVVRRRGDPSSPAINPLEVLGGCVAILAGLAALAGQFYGVGHHERPPPDARAGVQEIQTRVPRDEYLEALGKSPRGGVNGRQLGNVIWVRVDLDGYGSKPVELHWASYGTGAGAGELPRTYGHHPIPTEHEDHQRVFFPVWVGVPKVKFEVHIRVVRGDPTRAVRAMASTGPMRGDARRYVCRPAT